MSPLERCSGFKKKQTSVSVFLYRTLLGNQNTEKCLSIAVLRDRLIGEIENIQIGILTLQTDGEREEVVRVSECV